MNDETFNFEERTYIDPTIGRDERLEFIDTLRETQGRNTEQIQADTYALGSQLPPQRGGLSGAEQTFQARYQTPQTEQTVANLRTAAQQSALNQALTNLQNAYKKRYNDAVLAYQKRASASNNGGGTTKGNTLFEGLTPSGSASSTLTMDMSYVPAGGTVTQQDGDTIILDSNGNVIYKKVGNQWVKVGNTNSSGGDWQNTLFPSPDLNSPNLSTPNLKGGL